MKKSLLLPAIALTIVGSALFVTQASAQGVNNPQQSLVQKIAEKFNLNKDEVQAVFDEDRAEHHVQMQKRFEKRLSQLVTDGKLTEDQKTKILAKFTELEANRKADMEKMKSLTSDERKTAIEAHRNELQQWADENGIDLKSLGLFGRHGMQEHHGMMGN